MVSASMLGVPHASLCPSGQELRVSEKTLESNRRFLEQLRIKFLIACAYNFESSAVLAVKRCYLRRHLPHGMPATRGARSGSLAFSYRCSVQHDIPHFRQCLVRNEAQTIRWLSATIRRDTCMKYEDCLHVPVALV